MKKEAGEYAKTIKIKLSEMRTLYVGYRELSEAEKKWNWGQIPIPYPYADQINNTIIFRGFTISCDFIEKDSRRWQNDGCIVRLESNLVINH